MAGIAASATDTFVKHDKQGSARLDLLVDGIHCANCIRNIESGVGGLPGVENARVNFSTKRLHVAWDDNQLSSSDITRKLHDLGYEARPIDTALELTPDERESRRLLLALAVAGFATANVMLLSVGVWAGGEMGPDTRNLLHAISGVIALPVVAFSGRIFFYSAWRALRSGQLNMDVPISLAVILACVLSVFEARAGGAHAYFDAAVMLLFFLLIGRFLDFQMRRRARSAASELVALQRVAATVIGADGNLNHIPSSEVKCGDLLHVAQGERVPVDGMLTNEAAEFDMSLLTGETVPARVAAGERVFGGTINLSSAVAVRADTDSQSSTLAEIIRLMETAEQSRARYVRLADQAARIYAPAVHILAAVTFLGWWLLTSMGWEYAATNAIAVLIVTCPCALGLAVPVVQVVAAGRLFRHGIFGKSADGLERLAEIDYVVFDKTGTLTHGAPELVRETVDEALLARAATLARNSTHPLSKALARAAGPGSALDAVKEVPGEGLEARTDRGRMRLGNAQWCGGDAGAHSGLELWFENDDGRRARFTFHDNLRPDAASAVADLKQMGFGVELLSGDRPAAVAAAAKDAGIETYQAALKPADKIVRLAELKSQGRKVLMVGDGLNDAPSLAAAYASLSPASAADISQAAADFVFQGEGLDAVPYAVRVARSARGLVLQNFGLAFGYNVIAVPLAVFGFVTPLIAALAMSGSSIVVTLNALRLNLLKRKQG